MRQLRLYQKAFMTNVYQSPAMAEYINAIIVETREHKIYCQRTVKLLVQGIVIELLRRYDELRRRIIIS